MGKDLSQNQRLAMHNEDLTGKIIGCAMKVHSALGPGFLESVYRNALAYELRKAGMIVEIERPIEVRYDGVTVGNFFADLFVSESVIVETKAIQQLAMAHEVQLVNYLTATGIDLGLLLNFGAVRLDFKRKYRVYRGKAGHDEQDGQDKDTLPKSSTASARDG